MSVVFGDPAMVTTRKPGAIKIVWGVREVFKHACKRDAMFDSLIISHVTEEPMQKIADYLGLELKKGNAIAGTRSKIPTILFHFEYWLWCYFVEECKYPVLDMPWALSDYTIKCVNMTLYVWLGFMRVPGQSWYFLKDRTTVWHAMTLHGRGADEGNWNLDVDPEPLALLTAPGFTARAPGFKSRKRGPPATGSSRRKEAKLLQKERDGSCGAQ